jgi:hypothetical protein
MWELVLSLTPMITLGHVLPQALDLPRSFSVIHKNECANDGEIMIVHIFSVLFEPRLTQKMFNVLLLKQYFDTYEIYFDLFQLMVSPLTAQNHGIESVLKLN